MTAIQTSQLCPGSMHVCAVRVTRLNGDGTVAAGPKNAYVSQNVVQLNITPDILAGDTKQVVSGCDCISVSYRGYDKLMRFNLELDLALLELPLLEIMTGSSAILDGAPTPNVKGLWWPQQNSCDSAVQPKVAVEAWSDMWADDDILIASDSDGSELRYIHWLFTASHWHLDQAALQNDFYQPKLMGFTRSNAQWGLGPYSAQPESAHPQGGMWLSASIPTAQCGYITASSSQ